MEIQNTLELIIRRSTGFLRRLLVSKYICGKEICNWSKKGNLYHFYFITKTDNPRDLKSASIYIGYDSITGHEEKYAEEIKKQYSII